MDFARKSATLDPMTRPFHGDDEGSNPSGDARFSAPDPADVTENVTATRQAWAERVLYIGQSVDVGRRLSMHEKLVRLDDCLRAAPPFARARTVPFVRIYEGDPLAVEEALRARHGLPPWNAQPIRSAAGPLRCIATLYGREVWRAARHDEAYVSGGYAIGVIGKTAADTIAVERATEMRIFDAARAMRGNLYTALTVAQSVVNAGEGVSKEQATDAALLCIEAMREALDKDETRGRRAAPEVE